MLVLSRKEGERIVVPACQVEITVLEIRGARIRLGISAPAGTKVLRKELWEEDHAVRGQSVPEGGQADAVAPHVAPAEARRNDAPRPG